MAESGNERRDLTHRPAPAINRIDMDQLQTPRLDAVSLVMDEGSVNVRPQDISFHSHDGVKVVPCGILRDALLDLGSYHRLSGGEDELFRALLAEIERLASAKYRAGRLDRNGTIMIGPADILLYGFERSR
jgi:Protein of unknown function (DUF1488)